MACNLTKCDKDTGLAAPDYLASFIGGPKIAYKIPLSHRPRILSLDCEEVGIGVPNKAGECRPEFILIVDRHDLMTRIRSLPVLSDETKKLKDIDHIAFVLRC
jgi:hypothetical protein